MLRYFAGVLVLSSKKIIQVNKFIKIILVLK